MSFQVVGRIEVDMRFDEFLAETEASVNRALVEWGELALHRVMAYETRVGDASSTRRVYPGKHLRDSFRVSTVFRGLRGFIAGDRLAAGLYILVYTDDVNAIWQELGTRGRRRKKLAASTIRRQNTLSGRVRAQEGSGNPGVKPLYFMRRALRDTYQEGLALIERALQ